MSMKKRAKLSAEFNMSSLTDIIFLLLIFFMLNSALVNPSAINLKMPSSSSQKPVSTRSPITVSVNAQLEITLNSSRVAKTELKTRLEQAVRADGRPAADVTVILNVDDTVDAQTLVEVVDAMNDVGVKMILAVQVAG